MNADESRVWDAVPSDRSATVVDLALATGLHQDVVREHLTTLVARGWVLVLRAEATRSWSARYRRSGWHSPRPHG